MTKDSRAYLQQIVDTAEKTAEIPQGHYYVGLPGIFIPSGKNVICAPGSIFEGNDDVPRIGQRHNDDGSVELLCAYKS